MTPDDRTPEQIRAEIDSTRRELGDTVEALAEKTDVKAKAQAMRARAQAKVEEVRREAQRNPRPFAIGAAVLVLFALWRRRRS
jgi:MYXO-CTERM domain-containing protein